MTPEGWSKARLGDLGYTFGGLAGKSGKDFGTGSATFVTFMNVMANVVLSADGVEAVNVELGEAQNQLRAGDVIFNGSSETPEEVGFGATVPETLEGVYLNSFCFGFRCHSDAALDATFLSYLTRSPVGRELIRPMAQGSTRYNLAKTNLLNGLFPIPPLAEQQAISEALSDADARIKSLDALIAKKRDMKQAAMQQLLTGRTRLLGFTDEWNETSLGDIARVKTGSRNNQDKVAGGRYPFFVRSAFVESIDSYSYEDEAILIPGEGGIGEIFHYVNGPHEVHQRVYRVSEFVAETCPRFVFLYLRSFFGLHALRNTVKATVDSLRLPTFLEFKLMLPSLKEQEAIAQVLWDVDGEIDALVAQREKAELVKQGMMQELLSGRVRLA